jgi:hypothetical protein
MFPNLKRKLSAIFLHENWMIGWIDAPIAASLDWTTPPPIHWIAARSAKRYLADPFSWPGKPDTLYCEHYDFATRSGSIMQLQNHDGQWYESPVAIPLPGHLSYPFLFAHGSDTYCLPESAAAGKLALLRRDKSEWRHYATPLPATAAADSTLFEHDGNFWIAYTNTALGAFDNLNLCYASSLAGPWTQHPLNPVRRGLASSRCGGTVFSANGQLYRPAQDCTDGYGRSLRIMRIVECSPETYREEETTHITPAPGMNPHGLHTLSAWGDKCLIDGKRLSCSPSRVMGKAWRRIRRLL